MAATVTVDATALKDLAQLFLDYAHSLITNTHRVLLAAGYLIENEARETIIQGPTRTGTIYTRGGRTAVRSAPGQPAKNDTGILQSALRVVQHLGGSKSTVEVGYLSSIAPYGKYLENPSGLNRQVLGPALTSQWPRITRLLERELRKV